nr:hypothetical protein [Tanacetum cinerariifolium]
MDDVMRLLSFDEMELDGEAGFGDVACSSLNSYGLSHDEWFRVDNLDLNLNLTLNLNVPQTKMQEENQQLMLVEPRNTLYIRVDEVVHGIDEEAIVHGSGEEVVKHGNGEEAVEETSGEQV